MKPSFENAKKLVYQYIENESLRKHCLYVASVMRYFARKKNIDETEWAIIGLIHDLDWEKFPEQHCYKTKEILEEIGWPENYIRAILSHGWSICTDIEPKSDLEKTLYAVDELTGFIVACALVRPSKSFQDLQLKSVKKKWKTATFASGVNRSIVTKGAKMLGVEIDNLIEEVIIAMREVEDKIGI